MSGFTIFVLAVIVLYFYLAFYLAQCFTDVAGAKGFREKRYFWVCFLFPIAGYLLVIALPDRGVVNPQANNELPELNDLPEL